MFVTAAVISSKNVADVQARGETKHLEELAVKTSILVALIQI